MIDYVYYFLIIMNIKIYIIKEKKIDSDIKK